MFITAEGEAGGLLVDECLTSADLGPAPPFPSRIPDFAQNRVILCAGTIRDGANKR